MKDRTIASTRQNGSRRIQHSSRRPRNWIKLLKSCFPLHQRPLLVLLTCSITSADIHGSWRVRASTDAVEPFSRTHYRGCPFTGLSRHRRASFARFEKQRRGGEA